jgi:hypothetical protein
MSKLAIVALTIAGGQRAAAQGLEPIAYAIRIPTPATHEIVVQATVPAFGRSSRDLMIPTWSPGWLTWARNGFQEAQVIVRILP